MLDFHVMDNIDMYPNKKMVAAETVGFTVEADFFKAGPMILGFGCHGQHGDASP